ncbi:MAG: hypothetical protein HQM07_09075 [Zetaproteobacteria bacterium]|nr:hypothetical protein [Zetaproteobacteria bacterium]
MIIQTGTTSGTNDRLRIDIPRVDAQVSIQQLDAALATLAQNRAALGAYSNQMSHLAANLDTSLEQTSNTISAIKDTDIAMEMAEFTKAKIMVQSGTSMVSQANQNHQNILSLFK